MTQILAGAVVLLLSKTVLSCETEVVQHAAPVAFSLNLLTSWRPLAQKATWRSIGGKPKQADRWREDGQKQTDSEERINTEAVSASQHTNTLASLDVSFYTIMSANHRWFALHAARLEAISKSSYDLKGRGVYQKMFLVLI